MKKVLNKIVEFAKFQYNSIWNTLHYKRMIFNANFKHWCSRNKYEVFFVIPFTKTSLGVISQNQRKQYNNFALKNGLKKFTHNELIKASYYTTGKIITLNKKS